MAASLLFATVAHAEQLTRPWQPDAMFVQGGAGGHVGSGALGAAWSWRWEREYEIGQLTGYTEALAARWSTYGPKIDEHFNQFSVTPVLRLYLSPRGSGWFIEAGIGGSVISPKYRNDTRVFSTIFNFGDHVGIGRRFGEQQCRELALRIEHFSNGHIKEPNPGENFVQLRYTQWF